MGPIDALTEQVKNHTERLAEGDMVIQQIQADLALNTAATTRIEDSTKDIVAFFESMKGAFRVLNWIGKLAGPIGKIVALVVALISAWQLLKPSWLRW